MDSIQITALSTENKKELNRFIQFAWDLYEPAKKKPEFEGWIPPLRMTVRDALDTKKNPFYKRCDIQLFLATRNGKPVGRIAAIDNHAFNEFQNLNEGHYGFFECINDQEVANSLFNAAADWVKKRGRQTLQGPYNPSTNHECGLLVRGHSQHCTIMTTWNPKYYQQLHENAGFAKAKDLIAYWLPTQQMKKVKPELFAIARRAREKSSYTFREFSKKHLERDVGVCFDIYNSAWEKNWGFFPMTREEFMHSAKDMSMILNPKFAFIAEKNGKPAGFMIALPDLNYINKMIPSGKLSPLALLKIVIGKYFLKTVRIMALGVKPEFRNSGVFAQFTSESFLRAEEVNLVGGEASWMLEDNDAINKPWRDLGAPLYRRWRLFEKKI